METKIIYYVHGTTYDNASKRCSGWKQVELNELGKEQAANLGKNTKFKFDVLFSSDLVRAIDSANIAFPSVEKYQDKRLRECNYGDYDGEDKKLVVYEVITKHISWEEANKSDWRKTGDWQPGWEYTLHEEDLD